MHAELGCSTAMSYRSVASMYCRTIGNQNLET